MAIESFGEAIAAPPVVGEPIAVPTIKPRAYQQEMLAESLRQNTIVAVSSFLSFYFQNQETNENEDGNGKWEDTDVR